MQKHSIWIVFLLISNILGAWNAQGHTLYDSEVDSVQIRKKQAFLQKHLIQLLQFKHYTKLKLTKEYSHAAFDNYMESLDFAKQYLLQSDIDALHVHKQNLKSYLENGELDLFTSAEPIFKKRMQEVRVIVEDILATPFDFSIQESFETDEDKREWFASDKERKEFWRKSLKLNTLGKLYALREKQNKAISDSTEIEDGVELLTAEEMEAKARESVRSRMEKLFLRYDKISEDDKFENYMNSLIGVLDPHTNYLAPKTNEDFNISMTGKLEGIGARLSQKDNEISVENIIPGSPCDLQGDLEVSDVILKAAEKDSEPTDLEDLLLSDAIRYIRGKKGTTVLLTVRKVDGRELQIPIVRDVIVTKETFAKSAIIDDAQRVGYIKLPRFYTDFNDINGASSSKDVAKELRKLQAEGMESLILDLRNNGGGGLMEAIKITGLFIDHGPVVQVKDMENKKKVYPDNKKGIQFDGPMVVLVNHGSASASEIVAGALQDYDRATIVGSNKTFGKGTVQNLLSLDRFFRNSGIAGPLGSLKLTTSKFFRVNGSSTQNKGVTPDIIFPDKYHYFDLGESELEHALAWDSISKERYEGYMNSIEEEEFHGYYAEFLMNDPVFCKIDSVAKELKSQSENTTIELTLEGYTKLKSRDKKISISDLVEQYRVPINVANLHEDLTEICADSTLSKINDKWLTSLEKDIYLHESLRILKGKP